MPSKGPATRGLTVSDWLRYASGTLQNAGATSPRREAEAIAAHVLGVRWGELWSRADRRLTDVGRASELLERRVAGEPLSYVLGEVGFFGLELVCGPGVLVPRPETESVVEATIDVLDDVSAGVPEVVVDVGTGTGAIAIAVANERQGAEVWATEASTEALRYARKNVDRTRARVRLLPGNLLQPLPARLRGAVAVVVSNPPYLAEDEFDSLPPDVRWEPREALVAGPTGDEVIARLCAQAPEWVHADGALVLEVGTPEQAARTVERLRGWRRSGIREDLSGRPRAVWAAGPPR